MEHPVVEAIHEEWLQQGIIWQSVDIGVEGDREARPVVKEHLEYEQCGESAQAHAAHEGNPERHEQVEPEQDDEEIELVFRTAEEEQPTEVERRRQPGTVEQSVMDDVEQRPDEIGDEHGLDAPQVELAGSKRSVDIEIVEQAECGNEEEDRHTEACENLEKRNEMGVGGGVAEILRPDVDADDTHHGDAADIFDGGEAGLALFLRFLVSCLRCGCLHGEGSFQSLSRKSM